MSGIHRAIGHSLGWGSGSSASHFVEPKMYRNSGDSIIYHTRGFVSKEKGRGKTHHNLHIVIPKSHKEQPHVIQYHGDEPPKHLPKSLANTVRQMAEKEGHEIHPKARLEYDGKRWLFVEEEPNTSDSSKGQ